MEVRSVCSVRYIKANESLFEFKFNGFQIVKGSEFLDMDIFTQDLIEQAGKLNLVEFLNSPFFYNKTQGLLEDWRETAISNYHELNQLIKFLWFSKDNSINLGHIFDYIPTENKHSSNSNLAIYSNSEGNYEGVEFARQDFDEAVLAYEQFSKLGSKVSVNTDSPKFETENISILDSAYHFVDYNKNTRIERAFSFLTMARIQSFLPLRISLYMSLLECLFTTDKQEVAHKVCERASLYLGGDYTTKIETFNSIKEAYAIRSNFFHGQEIDRKQDSRIKLSEHSKKVDILIRRLFKKVLFEDYLIFNGSNEDRVKYFNKLLFDSI